MKKRLEKEKKEDTKYMKKGRKGEKLAKVKYME